MSIGSLKLKIENDAESKAGSLL